MDDKWEFDFDLDPLNGADADEDSDGDGYSNLYEYEHGSDPLDENSPKRQDSEDQFGMYIGIIIVILIIIILLSYMMIYGRRRRGEAEEEPEPDRPDELEPGAELGEGDLTSNSLFERAYPRWCNAWSGTGGGARAGNEREGHAIDFGVFWLEHVFVIGHIACATQATTNYLLAEQLSAKGTNSHDVSDCISVPSFGKHGN